MLQVLSKNLFILSCIHNLQETGIRKKLIYYRGQYMCTSNSISVSPQEFIPGKQNTEGII